MEKSKLILCLARAVLLGYMDRATADQLIAAIMLIDNQ